MRKSMRPAHVGHMLVLFLMSSISFEDCHSFSSLQKPELAKPQRLLLRRVASTSQQRGRSAPTLGGMLMLWAEGPGGGEENDNMQFDKSSSPSPSARSFLGDRLLETLRETHHRQVHDARGSSGAGLLDVLPGTGNKNILDQIMRTTAKDKRGVNEMGQLLRVVNALTSCPTEGGCPWTHDQDAMAIIAHAKGELDEIAEEIQLGDAAANGALESELGDLLFNTLLLIKLCERDGLGGATLEGAAASARAKLRRRAPFIFGEGVRPKTPEQANAIWKAAKKKEKEALAGPPRFIEGMGIYDDDRDGEVGEEAIADKREGRGKWRSNATLPTSAEMG